MKKLYVIFSVLFLTVIVLSGCSNQVSPRQVAKYNQIDSEATTMLGAIFTDETAFNATNSSYISAGYYSTKGLNLSVNTIPHTMYSGEIPSTAQPPYKCINSSLENNSGKIMAGFPNMGFLPRGKIYFYYFVKALSSPSKTLPAKLSSPLALLSQPYVSCGNGFEAFAVTNLNGNIQVYAVNDYSSNAVLVYGKSYRKYLQRQNIQNNEQNQGGT